MSPPCSDMPTWPVGLERDRSSWRWNTTWGRLSRGSPRTRSPGPRRRSSDLDTFSEHLELARAQLAEIEDAKEREVLETWRK